MSKDDHWITARIDAARKLNPSVSHGVSTRLKQLLNGALSERPFSTKDLEQLSKALISDMLPSSANPESMQ